MWRKVLIQSSDDQARTGSACAPAHRASQREELRGKIVGLLQSDDHCGGGGHTFSICTNGNLFNLVFNLITLNY